MGVLNGKPDNNKTNRLYNVTRNTVGTFDEHKMNQCKLMCKA